MSKKLENFMEQNNNAFNDYEPSTKLWDNLEKELRKKQLVTMQQTTVKKLAIYKWLAAASITLLLAMSVLYFTNNKTKIPESIVNTTVEAPKNIGPIIKNDTSIQIEKAILKPTEEKLLAKQSIKKQVEIIKPSIKKVDTLYNEMIAFAQTQKHFATLINYKEKEIKKLSQADTNIYKRFAVDMEGLNKSYKKLSTQLPKTNNKSALINAMIYNLQIQIDLLNKQLIILNKIESSQKKETYENNI